MDIPQIGASSSSSTSTPIRPRKRKARPETWKKAEAKTKRSRGESYISPATEKIVESAKQGPPCSCKKKCFEKFTPDELSKIFRCFWELGDKNVQDAYLHGLIRVRKVQRHRKRKEDATQRSVSYVYVVSVCESRPWQSSSEWELNMNDLIFKQLGRCEVHLFATRLNHKVPQYVSWRPDPFAIAKEAVKRFPSIYGPSKGCL